MREGLEPGYFKDCHWTTKPSRAQLTFSRTQAKFGEIFVVMAGFYCTACVCALRGRLLVAYTAGTLAQHRGISAKG